MSEEAENTIISENEQLDKSVTEETSKSDFDPSTLTDDQKKYIVASYYGYDKNKGDKTPDEFLEYHQGKTKYVQGKYKHESEVLNKAVLALVEQNKVLTDSLCDDRIESLNRLREEATSIQERVEIDKKIEATTRQKQDNDALKKIQVEEEARIAEEWDKEHSEVYKDPKLFAAVEAESRRLTIVAPEMSFAERAEHLTSYLHTSFPEKYGLSTKKEVKSGTTAVVGTSDSKFTDKSDSKFWSEVPADMVDAWKHLVENKIVPIARLKQQLEITKRTRG